MKRGFIMVFLFIGVTSLFAKNDELNSLKEKIKIRSNKHIENIKNFQNCVRDAQKIEQIKICKDNVDRINLQIKTSSGLN